jgi:hypothetical protein
MVNLPIFSANPAGQDEDPRSLARRECVLLAVDLWPDGGDRHGHACVVGGMYGVPLDARGNGGHFGAGLVGFGGVLRRVCWFLCFFFVSFFFFFFFVLGFFFLCVLFWMMFFKTLFFYNTNRFIF